MGELRPGRGNHVDLLRSLLILVVEDDPLIALDLKATLEHAGVVVLGPAGRLERCDAARGKVASSCRCA